MVAIKDGILKELNILKRELMKKFEKKELTKQEYEVAMSEVKQLRETEISKVMASEKEKDKIITKTMEEKKMEEKKPNVKPKKEKVEKPGYL